jgi:hypothetical protein
LRVVVEDVATVVVEVVSLHWRSEVDVGAVISRWLSVHSVTGVHTRS